MTTIAHLPVTLAAAQATDIPWIAALIAANQDQLLPRGRHTIHASLDSWIVASWGDCFVGCGALLPLSATLGEVRSLVVCQQARGGGVGQQIVRRLVDRAAAQQMTRVLALTRAVGFFERLGFQRGELGDFPEKIAHTCVHCPRRLQCDEVAVVYPLLNNL